MADERIHTGGPEAPPAGEAVHLPGPSYLPVIVAVGIAIAVVGVVQSWIVVALGLVITLVAVWRWVREARQDMAELPLHHRH
ncbi:MAG: aa3-type cytochrome oxidase subunit IV [Thermoleophilaceae bacterium]